MLCRLFLRISSREMMYGMRRSRRIPFVYSLSRLRSRGLIDDFRKGVTTFEETERIARRVLGGAHPVTEGLEIDLRSVREVLHRRENGEHVIYTTRYLQ